MEARTLYSVEECPKMAFLQSLNLKNKQEYKYVREAIVMKQILTSTNYSAENTSFNFKEKLEESLPDYLFYSKLEKRCAIDILRRRLERYAKFEQQKARRILRTNGSVSLLIGNKNVDVSFDMIIQNRDGGIEIISFESGQPSLTLKPRNPKNHPNQDIRLFMLYMAGRHLYPMEHVSACFYHLKSKYDKGDTLEEDFEVKEFANIVQYRFNSLEIAEMLPRVEENVNKKLSLSSSMTCDKGTCKECYSDDLCVISTFRKEVDLKPLRQELKKVEGTLQMTEGQREAVFFEEGIARVNAGAGTGKTTTVALRVVKLLQNGVNPKDILLITFTKKAVEEMFEKITFWLREYGMNVNVKELNIYTFNGFGMAVAERNFERLGFSSTPTILSRVSKFDILFELLEENPVDELDMRNPLLNFPYAKGAVINLSNWFDIIKIKGITEERVLAEECGIDKPTLVTKVLRLYNLYNQKLKEKNMMEYQDQILYAIKLLKTYEDVREEFKYHHIMVDEYQDTDPSQVQLMKVLMGKITEETPISNYVRSLMVVGDDAQAIYKFRLADQNNILNFHEVFPEVQDIFLSENFRSTASILHTANLLNEMNTNKIEKSLISGTNVEGSIPHLIECESVEKEYEQIAERMLKLAEQGYKYQQFAVLARTGEEIFNLQKVLEKYEIPCQLQLPVRVTNYKLIQDVMHLAKVIQSRDNKLSYAKYLLSNLPYETAQTLMEMDRTELHLYIDTEFQKFQTPEVEEEKLPFFFEYCTNHYGEDSVARDFTGALSELNFHSMDGLVAYLDKMVNYNDNTMIEKTDTKFEAVTLITAHSSKGKEYDVVFVVTDKYGNQAESPEDFEEERRLLFVSITRARKLLEILWNRERKSCFVSEMRNVEMISTCSDQIAV